MDRIEKTLEKLNLRERQRVKVILERIASGNFYGVDVQKLRGHDDIYRARVGSLRVIFRVHRGGTYVLAIERRSEVTYRHF